MAKEYGLMEHNEGPLLWANSHFWQGFMKQAAVKIPTYLTKIPSPKKVSLPKVAPNTAELPRLPQTLPKAIVKDAIPPEVPKMSDAAKAEISAVKTKAKPGPSIDYSQMNAIPKVPEENLATISYGPKGPTKYTPPKPA